MLIFNRLKCLVLLVVLYCLLTPHALGQTLPNVEDITKATRQRNDNLDSIYVRYRIKGVLLGSPGDAKKYLNLVALVDEEKVYAFEGAKRYAALHRDVSEYADIAPEANTSEPVDDSGVPKPLQDFVEATDGSVGKIDQLSVSVEPENHRRFNGSLLSSHSVGAEQIELMGKHFTSQQKQDLSQFNQEYMWLNFHSVPDAFNSTVHRGEHRLPDAFLHFDVRLRENWERIDGEECIVIELGNAFILWCDPDLNFAVRRWDTLDGNDGHVSYRYNLSDFSEESPGIWFPKTASRIRWASSTAPADVKAAPLMKYEYTVKEIRVNDVDETLFETDLESIPAGTRVIDNVNTVEDIFGNPLAANYTMPADASKLDQVIAAAKSDLANSLSANYGLGPAFSYRSSIRIVFAICLIAVAFFFTRRFTRA